MRAHWRRPSARPSNVFLQAFVTHASAVVLSAKSITVGDGLPEDGATGMLYFCSIFVLVLDLF